MVSAAHLRSPLVIRPRGELDLATGPAFGDLIRRAARGAVPRRPIVVDLSEVTFLDSAGLRALCAARHELAANGVEFVLAEPRGTAARVIDLHPVARGIDVYPITEAAVAALEALEAKIPRPRPPAAHQR